MTPDILDFNIGKPHTVHNTESVLKLTVTAIVMSKSLTHSENATQKGLTDEAEPKEWNNVHNPDIWGEWTLSEIEGNIIRQWP